MTFWQAPKHLQPLRGLMWRCTSLISMANTCSEPQPDPSHPTSIFDPSAARGMAHALPQNIPRRGRVFRLRRSGKRVKGHKRHIVTDIVGLLVGLPAQVPMFRIVTARRPAEVRGDQLSAAAPCLRPWRLCRTQTERCPRKDRALDPADRQTFRHGRISLFRTAPSHKAGSVGRQPFRTGCRRSRSFLRCPVSPEPSQ
jgi:hypothetical protein